MCQTLLADSEAKDLLGLLHIEIHVADFSVIFGGMPLLFGSKFFEIND